MVVVDASGCRMAHAGVEAFIFRHRGDICIAAGIRQVVEKKCAGDGQANWTQTARDKTRTFSWVGIERHVDRLGTGVIWVFVMTGTVDFVGVVGQSVGGDDSSAIYDLFFVLRWNSAEFAA